MTYLQALPASLESHPSCRARSSIHAAVMAAAGHGALRDAPPELAPILSPPPRPWIPETVLQASLLAVADHLRMDDAAFLAWNHELNLGLYKSGVYRALMAFLSPRTLIERAASRWTAFHEGTTLTMMPHDGGHSASARLDFPPGLFTKLLLEVYCEVFRAGLVHSRGKHVTVEVTERAERSAVFVARWQ